VARDELSLITLRAAAVEEGSATAPRAVMPNVGLAPAILQRGE
jgi:hypothetical protein